MPITHKPKYPVVNPTPTLRQSIYNMSFQDYLQVTAFSAAGYTWGWFQGFKQIILYQKGNMNIKIKNLRSAKTFQICE